MNGEILGIVYCFQALVVDLSEFNKHDPEVNQLSKGLEIQHVHILNYSQCLLSS